MLVLAPGLLAGLLALAVNIAFAEDYPSKCVLTGTEVRERFMGNGAVPVAGEPAEFATTIKSDMMRLGKLIRDIGLRAYWRLPRCPSTLGRHSPVQFLQNWLSNQHERKMAA